MKKVVFVLVIVSFVGMPSFAKAVDFSVLLGTWEGVSRTTLFGEPFELPFVWTFTEVSDDFAIGRREHTVGASEDSFVVRWDASRGQFRLEDMGVYYFNATGNSMTGTIEFLQNGTFSATKNTDCVFESIDVAGFDLNTFILTLPILCIDGTIHSQKLQIRLKTDGTWEIVQ